MLRLRDFLSRRGDPLQLEALTGDLGLDRQMPEAEVASPGLALAGYTGRFAPNRIHVFGETEITYLNSLSQEERLATLQKFFGFELPCIFVTKGQEVRRRCSSWPARGACRSSGRSSRRRSSTAA